MGLSWSSDGFAALHGEPFEDGLHELLLTQRSYTCGEVVINSKTQIPLKIALITQCELVTQIGKECVVK